MLLFYSPTITIFFDLLLTTIRFKADDESDTYQITYKPANLRDVQRTIEMLEGLPTLVFHYLFQPESIGISWPIFLGHVSHLMSIECHFLPSDYLNGLKEDLLCLESKREPLTRKVDGVLEADQSGVFNAIDNAEEILEEAAYFQDLLTYMVEVIHVGMASQDREQFQALSLSYRPQSYLRLFEKFAVLTESYFSSS